MNTEAWQVPSFQRELWQGKKNDYCIVIPVINEGLRIKNLLTRMHDLGVHKEADIIIVDGGSTDGSLSHGMLLGYCVCGLLIKKDHGKLSAQLRCGYAYAIQQGYKGVITIDGNDKDDPASIPQFIYALENGTDFIQGSRFIKGGVAENTPISRDLAIRLVHAPILRLFSGFNWTDTTQGYRGYSSKLLIDPKLSIFRKIFDSYELLAYLSYRAPRLGYKCLEIATTRRYPKGEVPTKISALRGNLLVLIILFKACFGFYNPKD